MALFEEPSTLRSSSEKPSPLPKRPRVSFTTVSMRTFNGDDPKTLSSPTERALSPMADGLAPAEDSQEVTANVESLSRLVLEDELDARSKHVSINEPNHLERVLLKQASPMRTPTAYAEQETSPLPENWDLYKQFKSSQAASGATTRGAGGSPELKSTSHRISPHPGAFCAAALRSAVPPPAPAVAPLPTRGLTRPSKCSPRRSPDTVDMSGVVRSIQLGPQDSIDSAVPEGRKSFATFQSLEPGPEIYAVKQASRCLQEPLVRSKAMQRHQHHRSDLNSSAERFREMRDQVIKEAEEDQQLMEQKGQALKSVLQSDEQSLIELEEQVASTTLAVEASENDLRQSKKRLLRQKAQRVALQQAQSARSCYVIFAQSEQVELCFRGAVGSVQVHGSSATLNLRTRREELGRAWREALSSVEVEKVEDLGSHKSATVPVDQVPELVRRLDLAIASQELS
ncbi:unnamed protein product [Durusdinium trenchii]|uniref:Uncharacterized protein n=2 Tax=Durusdinium trenchii TaxID=1381693 RepID=A0ABP0PTY7_9DINO